MVEFVEPGQLSGVQCAVGSVARIDMVEIPHIGKQALIRSELMKCATANPMEFPTYGAFAPRKSECRFKDLGRVCLMRSVARGIGKDGPTSHLS